MKKRFFAIYALVGAFVASPIFTSCVEDEESASVTAIRDSKTEELKSIAALKKAEAQAEATISAANIALKQAEAEAQVAAAKLQEAKAALQNTENEAEAARLLVAKKQAEANLARIQGEIEAQELAIQAALLNAQADLLYTKKQLEQQIKWYEDDEKAELMALANKYSQAVTNLLDAKKSLISMESELASLEAGFADAKESLEETIAGYNKSIALQNIYIEQYKQYADYTEDLDALKKQQTEAQVAYNLASDKYNAANKAYWDAQDAVDTEALDELHQAIEDDAFHHFTVHSEYYDAESESYKHFSNFNWDFCLLIEREYNSLAADWVFNHKNENYSYEYEYLEDYTGYFGDSIYYEFEYAKDLRQAELQFGEFIDPIKADIKSVEETIKTDKAALVEAEKATVAAKKAWDDAAEADKEAKKADYVAKLEAETTLANNIKNNEAYVEARNKELAVWTGALDMLKNAETLEAALQEKIKAHNDAEKAAYVEVVEAWKARIDAEIVMTEADAELQAINELLNGDWYSNGAATLAEWIKNCENNIKYYQEQIEQAEKLLANWYINSEQMSYEDVIAWQKAQIEAQKAVVAAKEVAVKDAKAALDAAMPAEEEETPSEEDAPAEE